MVAHKYEYRLSNVQKLSEEALNDLADNVREALIIRNLSVKEACKELSITEDAIRYVQRVYNIRKTREQITQTMQRTNLRLFGTPHYSVARSDCITVWQFEQMSEEDKSNIIDVCNMHYLTRNKAMPEAAKASGVSLELLKHICDHYSRHKNQEELSDHFREVSLERFGVDHPCKNEVIKNKSRETCLSKYGVESYLRTDTCKEANKRACLELYGSENAFSSEKFQAQFRDIMRSKYGVEYTAQSKELQAKMQSTCLERYGKKFYHSSDAGKLRNRRSLLESHGNSPEVVDILLNEKLLSDFILSLPSDKRYVAGIARSLGCYEGTLRTVLHNYYPNLLSLIHIHESGYCHSYIEDELFEFVSRYAKVERNCRYLISPKEVDLYIPSAKLAIEMNGVHWHSDEFLKDRQYHMNKSKLVSDTGNFLYHIFEYEWKMPTSRRIIESQILNLLGVTPIKIYARKCKVKELNASECRPFLQNNHIQGFRNASLYLGLIYDNEIVSVMTFGKPYFSKGFDWEIYRFCSKLNTSVIGGFSKLFKYFITSYNPESVLTYSDCAKGRGRVYQRAGFTFLGQSAPNYVWAKESDVRTRYQCQMKNEKNYMESLGYRRVYDCGNYKWAWYGAEIPRPDTL